MSLCNQSVAICASKYSVKLLLGSVLFALLFISKLHAQIAPVASPSNLMVEVKPAGTMPVEPGDNIASPQPYGFKELFLISHNPIAVYSFDTWSKTTKQIFDASQVPAEIEPAGTFALMNVAGNPLRKKVYMVFTSRTLPAGIPTSYLPDPDMDSSGGREDFEFIDTFAPELGYGNFNGSGTGEIEEFKRFNQDIYNIDAPDYQLFFEPAPIEVVYHVFIEFDYRKGKLLNPRPFLALQTQEGPFHRGGGLIVIPGNRLVYTSGDNLPFGMEGRRAPQDDSSHLSKLLIVDPRTGDFKVAAKGLRNVQHIQATALPLGIAFTDIGGVTAEEVNFIPWKDFIDTSTIENFGWGRNPDGLAREGTFYVSEGQPFKLGDEPASVGEAPVPEPGFRQPLAQYGRNPMSPFTPVAVSGPVVTRRSFKEISLAMGDLASGEVYATTDKITGTNIELFVVNLIDESGEPVGTSNSLNDLVGPDPETNRSDPRFFVFPNGEAGVLLEATGGFFVLTEK